MIPRALSLRRPKESRQLARVGVFRFLGVPCPRAHRGGPSADPIYSARKQQLITARPDRFLEVPMSEGPY